LKLRARRPNDRGFTLLELLIVSGLVIAIALVVVPSAQSALGLQTREAASKMAAAIRAMYGESVLSGRTCRLVFDLEEGAYWPECAEGRVRIVQMEESRRGQRYEAERRDRARNDLQAQAMQEIEAKSSFSALESRMVRRQELPEGVRFASVWTRHQPEPYTAGTAFLYFFPHGETERAYIHVARGDDDVYTVVVDPVTGRTRVLGERIEVPREELRR